MAFGTRIVERFGRDAIRFERKKMYYDIPLEYIVVLQFLDLDPLGSGGSISEEGEMEIAVPSLDETVYNFNQII